MKFHNKVTTVNFILAVMVVLLHSQNILIYEDVLSDAVSGGEYFISNTVGNLAVPSFFMISAYLFYRNYDKSKIISKYKTRAKSVLLPYLLWNLMYYIAFAILVRIPMIASIMQTGEVPVSFKELVTSLLFYKYNGVYWFMYQLILYIALAPLIWMVMKQKFGFVFMLVLYFINFGWSRIPAVAYGIHLDMLVFWCLGCYFATHKAEMFEKVERGKATAGCCIASVLLLGLRFVIEFNEIKLPYGNFILYSLLLINVVVFWFGLNVLQYENTFWWMKITFFIYSVHPLLVDFVKKGLAAILPHNQMVAAVNYLLAAGISLLVVFAVAKLLKKICPALWGILNGGRRI